MQFVKLSLDDKIAIEEMSAMATAIVREHYDPILGTAQNDYMLKKFQSPEAIEGQLKSGYNYYFVKVDGKNVGFMAFYPRGTAMYLSKLYLYKTERKKGYSRQMLNFLIGEAKAQGLTGVELNVNRNNDAKFVYGKLGLTVLREEKIDIGNGYYMDDYVYHLVF